MSLIVFEGLSYHSWLHSSLTKTRGVTRSRCKAAFIFLPTAALARNRYHKQTNKNPTQTKTNKQTKAETHLHQNKTKNKLEHIFLIVFTLCLPIP